MSTTGSTTNGDHAAGTTSAASPLEKQITQGMSHDEHQTAKAAARFGYGPLARIGTSDTEGRLPAFGGEFQPGLYKPVADRKFANPAPLGLCAFALTTFVLGLINMGTRNITSPDLVIGVAFAYGGLVQLLAGMWEMAVGNTFGATALSSYGGFWLSFALIVIPGTGIAAGVESADGAAGFLNSFGLYLMGWFIFTFLLVLCTLRSTVAFFLLFFTLDMAFLLLGVGYLQNDGTAPDANIIKAGGFFALLAAFLAWYNALAGIADSSNSFFIIPVAHFPWSEKAREHKATTKDARATV